MRRLAFALVLATLAGCSAFASKADYRAYRPVERAEDARARTRAMAAYLRAQPEGQWAGDVRAELAASEVALFDENKSTRDGLAFYLEVYPEGQYAAQARQRLDALESVQANRSSEQETAREVQRERREDQLAARRQWATNAVGYWTRILLGVDRWGSPIGEVAEANEDFDEAFGAAPRPRCTTEECAKLYELTFAIPVPGQTRIERTIRLLLRLRMSEGKLVRAEMLMPDRGFSRWYELENETFVIDQDPEQRQATIDWALERLIPAVRELAPDAQGIDVVPEPIDPPAIDFEDEGEEASAASGDEGALVLPLALQGLRVGDLRIVVF
ncbi:MAG TPA: hypothetical protein RMG45_22270, partial [Polyangiaceae bacterium LLY-WYZ-15_(1-7)]|nr:hypothetical protein [Polyangiaceae bacterium LLY-WYZ-15_(1-7)]